MCTVFFKQRIKRWLAGGKGSTSSKRGQAVLWGEGNWAEVSFEGCTGWGHEGGSPWQLESRQWRWSDMHFKQSYLWHERRIQEGRGGSKDYFQSSWAITEGIDWVVAVPGYKRPWALGQVWVLTWFSNYPGGVGSDKAQTSYRASENLRCFSYKAGTAKPISSSCHESSMSTQTVLRAGHIVGTLAHSRCSEKGLFFFFLPG